MKKGDDWRATRPRFVVDSAHRSVTGKLTAPVKKGERVGSVELRIKRMPVIQVPVTSRQTITKRVL